MIIHALCVGRLVLALVFGYAAWTKLSQPWEIFALSIDSYGVLPEWAVVAVARALPWLEMALGVLLLLNVQLVAVSATVSVLLVGFLGTMLRAWWLDLGIDCGCFGIGQAVSPGTLVRDGALALVSVAVTVGAIGRSRRASGRGSAESPRDRAHPAGGRKAGASSDSLAPARLAAALGGISDEERGR